MRSRDEIRRALDHLASAAREAKLQNEFEAVGAAIMAADILCWVMGEETPFAKLLRGWEKDSKTHAEA